MATSLCAELWNKNLRKFQNRKKEPQYAKHLLLIDKYEYEMDLASIVENTEWPLFCLQTHESTAKNPKSLSMHQFPFLIDFLILSFITYTVDASSTCMATMAPVTVDSKPGVQSISQYKPFYWIAQEMHCLGMFSCITLFCITLTYILKYMVWYKMIWHTICYATLRFTMLCYAKLWYDMIPHTTVQFWIKIWSILF